MKKFKLLILLSSIAFSTLATYLVHNYINSHTNPVEEKVYIQIPVASIDISKQTEINESMIEFIDVPEDTISSLTILTDKSKIINRFASIDIPKGSTFSSYLLKEKDMETPFALSSDYRAITITSTPLNSVGGFLKKDMFVDVLWIRTLENQTETQVAFQNVKVLAVGSPLNEGSSFVVKPETITLMLSLEDAQTFALMEAAGEVRLLLRPSEVVPKKFLSPKTIVR